ncbi:unnamed protein product [Peronospora farinosa]|nr:unnamed protein product [Peronospora farinosa]
MSTSSSPKTLTKEQLNLIETRRQEALARRRRIQQAARAPVYSPVVIRPDSADHGLQSVIVPIQEHHVSPPQDLRRTSSKSAGQSNSITHRVVTPEKTPTTNKVVETEHVRPQCFWDDLEAAAEIVQWENEQMAEVALEQLPATTATNVNQEFGTLQHEVRQLTEVETPNIQPPAVVSLSQELLAAADIIQWEKEHEVPGDSSGSDHELEAPQFQLLPVQITDDCEQQNEKLPETYFYKHLAAIPILPILLNLLLTYST